MIPIFAGPDIRSYLAAEKTGRLRLLRVCLACGGRLWGHGLVRARHRRDGAGWLSADSGASPALLALRPDGFVFAQLPAPLPEPGQRRPPAPLSGAPAGMSWRALAESVGRSVATVRRLVRRAWAEAPGVLAWLQEWWGELARGLPTGPPVLHPPEGDPLGACLDFAKALRRGVMGAPFGPVAAGLLDILNLLLQGDPAWL